MFEQTSSELAAKRDIYSVSEVNLRLKQAIAENFPLLWVEGEISNLARPASGHLYFSIKDKNAQIRCVMFRSSNQRVGFEICNGLQVIVRAKVSLYEARGDLQLIVDGMEEAGFGALQRQFEALKKKLHAEGLFDEQYKKPIPAFPSKIAVITSPSGAAIKDFLQVSQRRYPSSKKNIYAVPVQGENAATSIRQAIEAVNRNSSADVIVLIRGGGSIEDLWAFNDESLARAIAASDIPVITGIGHEIDYTIADFAADLRAPTPSVAAELSCPDHEALLAYLSNTKQLLGKLSLELIQTHFQSVDWLSQRLNRTHPTTIIKTQFNALKQLQNRLQRASQAQANKSHYAVEILLQRLKHQSPEKALLAANSKVDDYTNKLLSVLNLHLDQLKHRFELCTTTLQAVSPLNTLKRGYSITLENSSKVVIDHSQLSPGDQLTTYLSSGKVFSRVESTSSKKLSAQFPSTPKTPD